MDASSFGDWLKRRRMALHVTRDELAQRVGCAVVTLRKIEADERRPSKQIAGRLAEALDLSPVERGIFIKVARAEFNVNRLALLALPLERSGAILPSGTVTFLCTDIEDSAIRWEHTPQVRQAILARHDLLMKQAVTNNEGVVVKRIGDGLLAVFARALDGLVAASSAQHALQSEAWGEVPAPRIRMALHSGVAEAINDDYTGSTVDRVVRIVAAGHGGQILLSLATMALVRDFIPPNSEFRDLGTYRLKDLTGSEQIFQYITPDLPATFPPLLTLDSYSHNLPAQSTPLIGRKQEIARVCALLRHTDVRLVTLTGSGGSGKTRLGLQVAAELLGEFKHGIQFIALGLISNPDMVLTTITQTLGILGVSEQPLLDTLKSYLREKHLLIVLDNFEHVNSAAPLISELLGIAPQLKVLVTSRAPLHLSSEHEFMLSPLTLPDVNHRPLLDGLAQYEAVRLFIARAQAVQLDFAINNENAPAVAEICHRLDGLPLAIELAAARIKMFSPQMLLIRLEHRLTMLTGGARDLPMRQQTLRSTIEWSYNLLSASEKVLFRRLGVFVGGVTLEAVEAICNAERNLPVDVSDGIAMLLDQSLLQQTHGETTEPRFTMLETIREYALEQLELSREADSIRRQHATYYLALAELGAIEIHSIKQKHWLDRLEQEHNNFRAVLAWALRSDPLIRIRLVGALFWFWTHHSYFTEGGKWLADTLALLGPAERTAAWAKVLCGVGCMAVMKRDFTTARPFLEESLSIWQELDDIRGCIYALIFLEFIELAVGNVELASTFAEEGLARARSGEDPWSFAYALVCRGVTALAQGDLIKAQYLCQESLVLSRKVGDKRSISFAAYNLGWIAYLNGDIDQAATHFVESSFQAWEIRDKYALASNLTAVAATQHDVLRSVRLCGAIESLLEEIGAFLFEAYQGAYERTIATARAQLDEATFTAAWNEGRELSLEQVIAEVVGGA